MYRRLVTTLVALTAVGASAESVSAQGFGVGYTDIGPTVGLGGIGSASLAIGGRIEHGWKALPEFGNGVLGLQLGADYYSWSSFNSSFSYTPVGATVNYHFNLEDSRIDPFLGLGLGYLIVSCDLPGIGSNLCSNSALYFIGRAGIRYFMSDKLALYGDVGAGAATLNVGAMFRLK